MIKIFLTVRNRLAITKKCIEALKRNSTIPHQIYVYNNQTNYLVDDHFEYFCELYKRGQIAQVTFTTDASTFNAFSKATTCNMFALQHEQDPKRRTYEFLLMIDNDIIVTPAWDKKLQRAWQFVNKKNLKHIKVIGQAPGGIKNIQERYEIGGMKAKAGRLGGSGLWSVRNNFFKDVGILDLKSLVGHDKKHDQSYWRLLGKSTGGRPYIMGLVTKLGIHCGRYAGSVCNRLTRNRNNPTKKLEVTKFEKQEEEINSLDFDAFYKKIINNRLLKKDW